jgi:hypothetical protein
MRRADLDFVSKDKNAKMKARLNPESMNKNEMDQQDEHNDPS